MTRRFRPQGSHEVLGRMGGGCGDGLHGLGTCKGASKCGTLHNAGTMQLVTKVILAEVCRYPKRLSRPKRRDVVT